MTGFTPVPNTIFDCWLKELQGVDLKVLLVIIRQTLGYQNKTTRSRKQKDWISTSQLISKTGCSRRAISAAINSLAALSLVIVSDQTGSELRSAAERKGKQQLFYEPNLRIIDSEVFCEYQVNKKKTYAKNAYDLSKNIQRVAQLMLTTKDNPYKKE